MKMNAHWTTRYAIASLAALAGTTQAQNVLLNPGFDTLGGGSPGNQFASWTDFNNVAVNTTQARSAPNAAKAYGNFNGVPYNASGYYQEKPVTAGSAWKASVYAYNSSADPMTGLNFAAMNLVWFDASNVQISTDSLRVADASTSADSWHLQELTAVAPAGAVKVQYVLLHLQATDADTGSVTFDDASLAPTTVPSNKLLNPSFESLGGGSPGNKFLNWTDFNNTFVQNQDPRTGVNAAKSFGNWAGPYNASGLFQETTTTPGQVWNASVWVRNRSDDPIQGLNFAVMNIEWYNASNSQISYDTSNIADVNTPQDTWLLRTATFTAPAGAVKARYVLLHLQESTDGGSVQFDDASLSTPTAACYANCDGSTGTPLLTAADFTCFLNKFRAADSYANCDGSTGTPLLTAGDFTCFLGKFRAGCP